MLPQHKKTPQNNGRQGVKEMQNDAERKRLLLRNAKKTQRKKGSQLKNADVARCYRNHNRHGIDNHHQNRRIGGERISKSKIQTVNHPRLGGPGGQGKKYHKNQMLGASEARKTGRKGRKQPAQLGPNLFRQPAQKLFRQAKKPLAVQKRKIKKREEKNHPAENNGLYPYERLRKAKDKGCSIHKNAKREGAKQNL